MQINFSLVMSPSLKNSPPFMIFLKLPICTCFIRHTATRLEACQLQFGINVPEAVEHPLGSQWLPYVSTSYLKRESMSRHHRVRNVSDYRYV